MTTYSSPFAPPPPRKKRGSTTAFWAVFTFGGLVLCSVLTLGIIATRGAFPRLGSEPSWTPQPIASSAPGAAAAGAERSADQPFLANDQIQNASGGRVNLRRTPGYQNKPPDDVIAVIQPGALGTVVAGPQSFDSLRWWQVRFPEGEGWMAERSNSGKVLLDRTRE